MNTAEAIQTVISMLNAHGLVSQGWTCKLSNTKRILGQCRYRDKSIRLSRIHVEMGSDDEVMNTIRHEVAHAITGPGFGHGAAWKRNAMLLGAAPKSKTKLDYAVPHSYEIRCLKCEKVLQKRHRRMSAQRLNARHCKCCGVDGRLTMVSV